MLNGNPQCSVDVYCGDALIERLTFIFDPVWWSYPYKIFDNSFATYGTDYLLGIFMLWGVYTLHRDALPSPIRTHASCLLLLYAASVLSGGLAHHFFLSPEGDHSSLLSPESATNTNTWPFRVLWTICVGTVCGAGGVQGSLAVAMAKAGRSAVASSETKPSRPGRLVGAGVGGLFGVCVSALLSGLWGTFSLGSPSSSFPAGFALRKAAAALSEANAAVAPGPEKGGPLLAVLACCAAGAVFGKAVGGTAGFLFPSKAVAVASHPLLAPLLWLPYTCALVGLTAAGGLSMLRPAADIFLAGATQAFPTMHVLAVWVANRDADAAANSRRGPHRGALTLGRPLFLVACLLNCPLIVAYPLVLSYWNHLPLGTVNACLHAWLTLAWGLQWWTLRRYAVAYGGGRVQNAKGNKAV
mmetsp:Transcript_67397/g.115774  ORF Transcript_67397/g.115774 Transcript_67397/m.115774 type:complete len:413 (+) Transcript_67397:55-1293(+)